MNLTPRKARAPLDPLVASCYVDRTDSGWIPWKECVFVTEHAVPGTDGNRRESIQFAWRYGMGGSDSGGPEVVGPLKVRCMNNAQSATEEVVKRGAKRLQHASGRQHLESRLRLLFCRNPRTLTPQPNVTLTQCRNASSCKRESTGAQEVAV